MAWAFVQDDAALNSGSSTAMAVAFTSAVTAGSLLVVRVSATTASATATCADSRGQTHVLAVGPTVNATLGISQWIFYFPNTTGGACTVTATFSASVPDRRMEVLEYSGIATASPLDVVSAATGNSAAANSGANTTTQNNDLVFGAFVTGNNSIVAGANFTLRQSADIYSGVEDRNLATAGSVSADITNASQQWIAQMAAFREAAGGVPALSLYLEEPIIGESVF